jgi:L-ascorbate metabolism protein UlaG (beta-lactamase superfamily)
MKVSLLGHSGFIVEGGRSCLVFDCYTDEAGLVATLPFGSKNIVFFVSHAHSDHFNRRIFDWAGAGRVRYVLGTGVPAVRLPNADVLGKGQRIEASGITVQAFGSTDDGVSFLVQCEGKKIFHAGDLNDWYWEKESAPDELERGERWFLDEIAPLADTMPDVAFLPVDGRLGRQALRGPLHFARVLRPQLIVPMHLCGGKGLPKKLTERLAEETIKAKVASLLRPGDSITF